MCVAVCVESVAGSVHFQNGSLGTQMQVEYEIPGFRIAISQL